MFKSLQKSIDGYVQDAMEKAIAVSKAESTSIQRREILLTEYKEIIQILKNWDTLNFGMLTAVGTISAAVITYSVQTNNQIQWGVIISLFLFWLFTYIWNTKLAEVRIDILIEIETELKMMGQYSRLRKVKKVRSFMIWVLLPFLGAFLIGPLLGFIISNPDKIITGLDTLFAFIGSIFK
jgi:hypothetical protein